MFKDDYKKANKNIRMTDLEKQEMLNAIGNADIKKRPIKKVKPIGVIAATLAACLILSAGLSITGVFGNKYNVFSGFEKSKFEYKKQTYNDIYNQVKLLNQNDYSFFAKREINEAFDTDDFSAQPVATSEPQGTGSGQYSKTNVQVAGVDEADVVKTNGKNIFAMNSYSREIIVYDANKQDTKKICVIENDDENSYFCGMYLYNNTLVVLSTAFPICRVFSSSIEMYRLDDFVSQASSTKITFYDINNPKDPKIINEIKQDGSFSETSRISDGILYTVTNDRNFYDIRKNQPETYIPAVDDGEERLIDAYNIVVAEEPEELNYTVITAIDLNNTEKIKSELAVMGFAYNVGMYASAENILLYQQQPYNYTKKIKVNEDKTFEVLPDSANSEYSIYYGGSDTELYLINMNKGNIKIASKAKIEGYINDQFSIDEYNDHFRIVSTVSNYVEIITTEDHLWIPAFDSGIKGLEDYTKNVNSLYILDNKLNETGKITDIAEGEMVKSARFFGDIGYFVTFRQTDPLFSVDLSNPNKPEIIGELKIPGFSSYLQAYGDGLLFGFGRAADIETGGEYGIKLSMFDVSDPANVSEISCKELKNEYSSASYNHKAILADKDKNLIGFPIENGYCIYSYTDGEFKKEGNIILEGDLWSYDMRGLYIDDCYYIVDRDNSKIFVLDLNSFELIAKVN